jgi:hypothetical protein
VNVNHIDLQTELGRVADELGQPSEAASGVGYGGKSSVEPEAAGATSLTTGVLARGTGLDLLCAVKARETVMHADPSTQRSGSLNEKTASAPQFAIAKEAAAGQAQARDGSLLKISGMKCWGWLGVRGKMPFEVEELRA